MKERSPRATLLDINLLQERYGKSFLASVGIHVFMGATFLLAPYILPQATPIQIGSGPGGGTGGSSYSVGIADELSGGAGMVKPSLTPQPPALTTETKTKEAPEQEAIALPATTKAPKKSPPPQAKSSKATQVAPPSKSNVIPTAPEPGAGGTGGPSGGSGGGRGGGVGVSIGAGTGGFGDSWYIRAVESRIGSNWIRPIVQGRVEIIYSFVILRDGSIRDIRKEKSSGNDILDLTAERAIRASHPFPPPPPEFQGRPIQFVGHFVHPPDQ